MLEHLDNGWWHVVTEGGGKPKRRGKVPGGFLTQDVEEVRLAWGKDAVTSMSLGANRAFVAMYNYSSDNSKEMSFQAGDHIEILERNRNGWWLGRKLGTGQVGFVPKNYLLSGAAVSATPQLSPVTRRF